MFSCKPLLAILFLPIWTTAIATPAAVDVQYLERKVEDLFRTANSLPVVLTRPNIQVRTTFEGDCMISIAEATTDDYTPEQFEEFLQNFGQAFPQVNPMAQNVIPLQGDPLQKQGVKSVLKFPFPLTDRIMVHWKYLRMNRGPQGQEHMLILSEQGNEELLDKHLSKKERENYVLARTFLCVYWILPRICSKTGKVQGSCIRYAFSGDTGGTIPAWVQNQVGPKTALDSVQGLLKYVKKQQINVKGN